MRYPLSLNIVLPVLWSALILGVAVAARAQEQPSGALTNPLQAQSLEGLSATNNRPLFSPSRRPVPPPPPPVEHVAEPPAPPAPPAITVVGIVIDDDGARAMVRSETDRKVERVQIGDDLRGWKVSEIEGRRLVLSLDGRSATFTLFSDERGKQSPDNSTSKAADTPRNVPQRSSAQAATAQVVESQPATSRKHRRSRQ